MSCLGCSTNGESLFQKLSESPVKEILAGKPSFLEDKLTIEANIDEPGDSSATSAPSKVQADHRQKEERPLRMPTN